MSRVGIIGVVDRIWSDRWQSENHLMSHLADRFETVWVDPAHHWRESLSRWRPNHPTFYQPPGGEGLWVYSPPAWLPHVHRPDALARRLQRTRLGAVHRRLRDRGCDKIVLYVWRPKYAEALELVDYDASVYHIIDEYSYSEVETPTTLRETKLLSSVDQVIVHSPALFEKKGLANPNTAVIPNGVDYAWLAAPREEPADLSHIPRPRIGYCGYVKRQLDWDLIETLVERHPDWSWIFVGATSPHPELGPIMDRLGAKANVHFLGAKSTRELARYPQHFDACIMPYNIDDYTRYIFPLKLHEYLAAGRPTIGASIRTLRDFEAVIELADGADSWSRALRRALEPESRTPEAVAARQAVAKTYDWVVLADRVGDLLDEILARAE